MTREGRDQMPLTVPLCDCHGVAMTRRNDRGGNHWRCSVAHRRHQNDYRQRRMEDPVFRLSEAMRINGLRRRQTIQRMKEAIG